uniref:Glycosyltransferase family 92 protein n=1 Tax=Globodera pallida TaxID=36090 RepID=A0A183BLF6_GLOPA
MLRRTASIWQFANCFENMPRTLFCYLLLLFIFHWDQYKVFWWAQPKHTSLGRAEHGADREHLFIYSSFIYDRRPPANFSGLGKVQLIVLFLADKFHRTTDGMQCVVTKNAISVQKMALQKELIHSLGICALDLFVLTCSLDGLRRDSALFDGGAAYRNMYSLVLTDVDWHKMQRKSTKLTLYPRQASYKPRGLVLCMSRVFLFEKWQLLITALETYRLFKAYEQHGLLQVRPGIRFPHQRGMPWDPNAETEFNGQILLAHDCFYEYRESAQFIGLIDWDDLLVPSVHFGTLPEAFAAAFTVNPDTAYFLVNKLEASFEEQPVTRPTRFNLRKLLTHGIRTAEMYNDEKMVVRPKALRGFWMHNSFNLETMKRAVKMFTNYTILLHLANEERVNPNEFQMPFMTKFDIDDMHLHASRLLKKLNKSSRAFKLPTAQPFYAALVACHSQIFAYFKSTDMNKSRCLSYSLCVLPTLPEAICAVSRSVFGTVVTKGGQSGAARQGTVRVCPGQMLG